MAERDLKAVWEYAYQEKTGTSGTTRTPEDMKKHADPACLSLPSLPVMKRILEALGILLLVAQAVRAAPVRTSRSKSPSSLREEP